MRRIVPRMMAALGVVALLVGTLLPGSAAPAFTPPTESPFADVATTHTFFTPITWLADRRISTGYDDAGTKRFDPSAPVLREQMAAFLYRLAGEPEVDLPSTSPFVDVPTTHVFFEAIVWLSRSGITTGYVEGPGRTSFRPSQPVLREQMAAFLHRLEKEPAVDLPAASPFVDVPASHAFYRPMVWLAERGITTGYAEGGGRTSFRPAQPVLREQMAAFLYRLEAVDAPPPPPEIPPVPAVRDVGGTIAADTVWGPKQAQVHRVTGDVVVAAGVTLTLLPGTVVKLEQGRVLQVLGTLGAEGTAASPVVLTSVKDDLVGGDTNGDGAASVPAVADFVGIGVAKTGSVEMTHARVSFADIAVQAVGDAESGPTVAATVDLTDTALTDSTWCVVAQGPVDGTFSGSVRTCNGVYADHAFDARNVDWGSPSGPAPYGTGIGAHGASIAVVPWSGYVTPARPSLAAAQSRPETAECSDVVLVGVRGSGDAPQGPDDATPGEFTAAESGFGYLNVPIAARLQEQLVAERPGTTVRWVAVQYLALSAPPFSTTVDYGEYVASIFDGVDKLDQLLDTEAAACPSTKFVLLGSSKGAMVIHLTLAQEDGPDRQDQVAGVVLLADPTRTAGSPDTLWETADVLAGPGVSDVSGMWENFSPGSERPLPTWAAPRTISLCHQGDVFCGFRPGASAGPHVTYSESEMRALADWQAARVAAQLE